MNDPKDATETAHEIKLSVIIPTKDRPELLDQALRSVFAALPDEGVEVIVVDDRSLVSPLGEGGFKDDPRLRVISSDASPGASGARNYGVGQARGARILFLDDDDLMLGGYPEWVLNQKADYGYSSIQLFSGRDTPQPLPLFSEMMAQEIVARQTFRRQIAGLGYGFWIDRAVFLKIGGIAEDILINEDTEFSIRLLRSGASGLRASLPGVMVRKHGGKGGERGHLTHSETAAKRAGYFAMILLRHADWLAVRPDAAKFLLKRQLKLLAKAHDWEGAQAVLMSPLAKNHKLSLRLYYATEALVVRLRRR